MCASVMWPSVMGAEEVVEGMDLALLKMKEGEKAEIRIAAQYAFGPEGSSSMAVPVPPNATVFYTVELLSLEKVHHQPCFCLGTRAWSCCSGLQPVHSWLSLPTNAH